MPGPTLMMNGCPITGCPRKVSRGKLMCAPHWGAVPPDLQRQVYSTYRSWLKNLGSVGLMRAYRAAATEAIESV